MLSTFAIVPDEMNQPVALFLDLEEAIGWALERYGGDTFRIKRLAVLPCERDGEPPRE